MICDIFRILLIWYPQNLAYWWYTWSMKRALTSNVTRNYEILVSIFPVLHKKRPFSTQKFLQRELIEISIQRLGMFDFSLALELSVTSYSSNICYNYSSSRFIRKIQRYHWTGFSSFWYTIPKVTIIPTRKEIDMLGYSSQKTCIK